MFITDIDLLARHERYKDLVHEAEHERLIHLAELQQPDHSGIHWKFTGWVGDQMVKWGSKLQLL